VGRRARSSLLISVLDRLEEWMKTMAVGLALELMPAVSCNRGESRSPVPVSARVSPRPTISALDQAVLDAVLADLATYGGTDSPVAFRGAVAHPLEVAPDSADWPVTVAAVLHRHEPRLWRAFPGSDEAALAEAAADLVSRTTRHAGFAGFRSPNPHVQVSGTKSTPKPRYSFLATRPIKAWPPGYSLDQRLAVVRMSIPWVFTMPRRRTFLQIAKATGRFKFGSSSITLRAACALRNKAIKADVARWVRRLQS